MGAQRSLDQAAQLTWFGEPYKADQAKAKLNNRRCRVLIKKPESTLAHSTSSTKSPKLSLYLYYDCDDSYDEDETASQQLSCSCH